MLVYQNNMYALTLHNVICQFYLNKAEKKKMGKKVTEALHMHTNQSNQYFSFVLYP